MDDTVDGANVLLHDGGVDAARCDGHDLVTCSVLEPDTIVGKGRGGRVRLEQNKSIKMLQNPLLIFLPHLDCHI